MNAKQQVIFLDIDGVLNGAWFKPRDPQDLGDWIDERNMAALNELIVRTGAKVVVSSAWRRTRSATAIEEILMGRGFAGQVIGKTPYLDGEERWKEIQTWIDRHPTGAGPRRYVILDDQASMGPLADWHVQTSPLRGLRAGPDNLSSVGLTR